MLSSRLFSSFISLLHPITFSSITICVASWVLFTSTSGEAGIVPLPASIEIRQGSYSLSGEVIYQCPEEWVPALELGLARLSAHSTLDLKKGASAIVKVSKDAKLPKREAYTLEVNAQGIEVKARSEAGVFYACQTLLQAIQQNVYDPGKEWKSLTVPQMLVEDTPRFAWRGLMLDSSRHFQTVEEVKRFIDLMAVHKLNVFHWHLTDSHGWRFESKKYPELTKKGAWRMQPGYPEKGKNRRYGGFYTQAEIKEVIAYAKERMITIVPEIDMPGHCFAMVAAYPQLGCLGKPQEVSHFFTYPAVAQKFPNVKGTDVLCVGKDETLKVCRNILDEVMELFPSKFIHIGGDEVNKSHWKRCSQCQKHMKTNGLANEHELQSWFIQQLDHYITQKNRRMIGWDEILEGGLAKNATVMSWQGEHGGIKAAKMGHDVVMSPQTYIYLDHGQSHSPLEPPHWPGHKPLDRVYSYQPVPKSLNDQEASHIIGVQANVWTVFIHENWLLDLQTWPRAAALAEVGWTPQALRKWDDFYQRMSVSHRKRLDALGVNYWWENAKPIGEWKPEGLKSDSQISELSYDMTKLIEAGQSSDIHIVFQYKRGAHALRIESVALLENDRVLSEDRHKGVAGSTHKRNRYTIPAFTPRKGARYVLHVKAYGDQGADSHGVLTMSKVQTKRVK
ncbi:family 20 glycosylhydrolase [Verrucomicrobiaceae bacterium N1E253]|uniref:beta-N-acetylhexosaminidase n=1 Tax=Oceaniferula marina TaxID=2748318 RepID=A0A851GBC9_9BACT|nr:beta-N-acetylhexosaminidase [Oceaniferula marina]NWK54726.1 family 20 glycosylhydrolase [Oceaniferula marina]